MARQVPPWLLELQEIKPQLFQDLPKYGSDEFKESGLGARFKGKFGSMHYKTFTDNIESQRQSIIEGARPRSSFKGKDFTKIPTFNRKRTVTERVGRGSFKNIPEWRGPHGEWTRFDPIVDRSYSADDDVRNIPVSTQLNLYEESNRSQALSKAAETKDPQGDGNPTNSWSVKSLQERGILNTNNTNEQIANTTNDVTVAGFKVGSFDKNTQETTKPATIPKQNQFSGNMDQLTLEATDYGANPDRAPLKSIQNPSGEKKPGNITEDIAKSTTETSNDPMKGFSDRTKDILNRNPEMKQDVLKDLKVNKASDTASSGSNAMGKISAVANLIKAFGKKDEAPAAKPMDTNINTDQLAWNLDPSLRFYT